MQRRGFLALAGAVAGMVGVRAFAEPLVLVPEQGSWVEDKGDYYVVRVPDFKTFANETFAKPVIVLLGERAVFRDVQVNGVCNIAMPRGGEVRGCGFDARTVRTEHIRPVTRLAGQGWAFCDNYILCGPSNDYGAYLEGEDQGGALMSGVHVTRGSYRYRLRS